MKLKLGTLIVKKSSLEWDKILAHPKNWGSVYRACQAGKGHKGVLLLSIPRCESLRNVWKTIPNERCGKLSSATSWTIVLQQEQ